MPTETKRRIIAELADQIARATLAIATDFSGLGVNELTELRRRLRARSAEYRVVKNRLVVLAAKEAGKDGFVELVEGSTGIVFGYGEAVDAAKALDEFIRATRSQLVVRNGILDGSPLNRGQITALASLPPKEELLARLLGQLQAPVARLVNVLIGPLQGLAIVLQRRAEQLDGPKASETDEPEAPETDEPEASETDEPKASETDEPKASETDEPKASETDEPEAPETDEPEAPETDEPEASETDEPEASETDEPEAPETDEPEASKTDEPEAPETDEPEASETDEPEASETDEPEAPETDEPEASKTDEPEAPETDEPEASETDEPEASKTDEPEAPEEPEDPEKDGTK